RQSGIHILSLCYHRALGPHGACRLCIVEVEGPVLGRTVATSCNLTVSEGYVVDTDSQLLIGMRKTILGLLFPDAVSTPTLLSIASGAEEQVKALNAGREANCALC